MCDVARFQPHVVAVVVAAAATAAAEVVLRWWMTPSEKSVDPH
jgi:hypothetical protein